MIEKLETIQNMAVFENFDWKKVLRDKGNNHVNFKKVNIIYGRNYSGKTTLSRIFRALEQGVISDKYGGPKFSLSCSNSIHITEVGLLAHPYKFRVFNEDFIKENLKFIIDPHENIKPFAILGEVNNELEKQITELETIIGDLEGNSGLQEKYQTINHISKEKENRFRKAEKDLDKQLTEKANNAQTGIKHNKLFGNANYNIIALNKDIQQVSIQTYIPISTEQAQNYDALLKEEPKSHIPLPSKINHNYLRISELSRKLIEKPIQISNPIQELINNTLLNNWVRAGVSLHEGKRDKCGFCGGQLPEQIFEKLSQHFNQESQLLQNDIDDLLTTIKNELDHIPSLFTISKNLFYSKFRLNLQALEEQYRSITMMYAGALKQIQEQLTDKKNNIFHTINFLAPEFNSDIFLNFYEKYIDIIKESNLLTKELSNTQKEAKENLRLYEVYNFSLDIQYIKIQQEIKKLEKDHLQALQEVDKAKKDLDVAQAQLRELKSQLKDESKGAEKVNEYLSHFFGYQNLSLQALPNDSHNQTNKYRFEIYRNDKKAYHLSEGECSLIAFCYFMAKLEDNETKGKNPIIWIDDPISSLDSNHIFFIYSLINSQLIEPKKFLQLFISTHNLDFLKYLKKLSINDKETEYFIINRSGKNSQLSLMPAYMKEYVTEFNFLFHQIYKCAAISSITDDNYNVFYNFGNNARKFLEIYLYYKYPDGNKNRDNQETRILTFLGDDYLSVAFLQRINNEYSHLLGTVERGASIIQQPEMQKVALKIISTIKNNDPEQYKSLLISINESDCLPDN